MPLIIVRNNIINMATDAIVNAANEALRQGGGVCGAIFKAAGEDFLRAECEKIGGCATGDAVITPAGKLKSKYIIHTVGPVWSGGKSGEEKALRSCYSSSLELAKKHKLESIAFPIISGGIYGYPKAEAIRIASESIGKFLESNEMQVYLVVFDKSSFEISKSRFDSVAEYISNAQAEYDDPRRRYNAEICNNFPAPVLPQQKYAPLPPEKEKRHLFKNKKTVAENASDASALPVFQTAPSDAAPHFPFFELDESFSQSLLRLIDEKGMTDVEAYKKANIDRKLFNKIKNNISYQPRKTTAIAFAIALELNLSETQSLLSKAGFTLSHSNKFDIIIEYFILNGIYDTFEINETLFEFDQPLLGV